MAVTFVDEIRAVDRPGQRAGRELAGVAAQPHRAAELIDTEQIAQLVNHLGRRVWRALRGVRIGEPGDVTGVLDGGPLESVADTEERYATFARASRSGHRAARAAIAEAARHQDAVRAFEEFSAVRCFERFGFHPLDVDLQPVLEAAVIERLVQALV
ncbi:MAG: hypothetical protein U0Q11_20340 [Vicinamibacterales bacterium]